MTYHHYAEAYTNNYNKAWLGRKLLAIPKAFWSALIKTIFHLAQGIIFSLIFCLFGQKERGGKHFKAMLFSSLRDLQESFGHFASFFYENYGLYHVQEADFHKTCYRLSWAEINKNLFDKEAFLREKPVNSDQRIKSFKKEFKEMSSEQLHKITHRLHPDQSRIIPKERLNDLNFDHYIVHAFDGGNHSIDRRIGRERMEALSEENFIKLLPQLNGLFIPFSYIPTRFFPLLNYNNLSELQVKYLFLCKKKNGRDPEPDDIEDAQNRMEELTEEQFRIIVSKLHEDQLVAVPARFRHLLMP